MVEQATNVRACGQRALKRARPDNFFERPDVRHAVEHRSVTADHLACAFGHLGSYFCFRSEANFLFSCAHTFLLCRASARVFISILIGSTLYQRFALPSLYKTDFTPITRPMPG